VIPVKQAVQYAVEFARRLDAAKLKGKTVSIIDGLLAATALHHNLTVVSRNVSDFAIAQVAVLNPWSA
jgi:predicted nucleic acid-binding protein